MFTTSSRDIHDRLLSTLQWTMIVLVILCSTYIDSFIDGLLDQADGRIVGHGVQVVLSSPVHARRYVPKKYILVVCIYVLK